MREFVVRGADVGYVSRIELRIEPSADDPSWHLQNVEVRAVFGYCSPKQGNAQDWSQGYERAWLHCGKQQSMSGVY
jgi:hypothetical protein